jgi:hypothetical protein
MTWIIPAGSGAVQSIRAPHQESDHDCDTFTQPSRRDEIRTRRSEIHAYEARGPGQEITHAAAVENGA